MELELDEVIENLEYLVSDSCTDTQFDYIDEIELAIQALEKQIPMKPKTNRVDSETTYCKCPSCNITTVLYRNCIMNYCKECGQRLDWSDEESEETKL